MKKILFTIAGFMAIIGGIIVSLYMMNKKQQTKQESQAENLYVAEKVTDECIDEYSNLENEKVEEANSREEVKLSPNAMIIFEKFYKECEHTIKNSKKIDSNMVNSTQEDIEKKYTSWNVKEFDKDKVVLYQEVDGECGEHYMLRDINGKINIYKIETNGNEVLIKETDIATKYLTETDMINMDNGLIVYGKESLNKLIEDFE